MRWIETPAVCGPRRPLLCTVIAALCAGLAIHQAAAQEAAPAAADAPAAGNPGGAAAAKGQDGAAETYRNVDQAVASQYGAAGLWRRANVKTLIVNAPSNAGAPAVTPRTGPPPRLGFNVSRNAIGSALPTADTSAATGHAGNRTVQIHVPANPAPRGAAINGTTMNRIGAGPGYIGGPARNHTGINGTSMRPRY
jgi:hypothetical protein